MILFIYVFLVASIILIAIGAAGSSARRKVLLPQEERKSSGIKIGSHSYSLFPFSQKFLEKFKLYTKIKNRLDAAHLNMSAQQFFSIKLIFMILAGTVSSPLFLGKFEPLILSVALVLGFILPDIWLNKKIAQRKYEIARVLPETVDLLGLCVTAGLDFTTSVKWIIEKKVHSNPMLEELTMVLEEIKWGKPRSQALKDMAKRLNVPEVSSFVQALLQAERMGTPVSEAFDIISEDTRLQRFHRGERFALMAPIKILIPLIFCILPLIGIVIGGPILLQFMQGGLFKGVGQ